MHSLRGRCSLSFPAAAVPLTHAGVVRDGMGVYVGDRGWRLAQVPALLQEAVTVDVAGVRLNPRYRLKPEAVNEPSEELDKLIEAGAAHENGDVIAVLPRADVVIFLAVPADAARSFAQPSLQPLPLKFQLVRDGATRHMRCLQVTAYSELPVEWFSRPGPAGVCDSGPAAHSAEMIMASNDAQAMLTPDKPDRGMSVGFILAVSVWLGGLLLVLLGINGSFPYYVTWDMDLVTVLDTVLIHSNIPAGPYQSSGVRHGGGHRGGFVDRACRRGGLGD